MSLPRLSLLLFHATHQDSFQRFVPIFKPIEPLCLEVTQFGDTFHILAYLFYLAKQNAGIYHSRIPCLSNPYDNNVDRKLNQKRKRYIRKIPVVRFNLKNKLLHHPFYFHNSLVEKVAILQIIIDT